MEEEEDTEEGEEDSEDEEEEEMCLPGMDGKEEVCTKKIETNLMQVTNQQYKFLHAVQTTYHAECQGYELP